MRKLVPTLVSLVVAVGVGFLSHSALEEDSKRLALATGLTTFLIGLSLSLLYEVTQSEERIVDRIKNLSALEAQVETIRASSDAVTDVLAIVRAAANVFGQSHPFFRRRAAEILTKVSNELASLASGRYSCRPEEELHMTKEALHDDTCSRSLLAVSFQDEAWWDSSHGSVYLDLHRRLKRSSPRIEMVRVFITANPGDPRLRDYLQEHHDAGITTHIVREDSLPVHLLTDFVLYDEALVRSASPPDQATEQAPRPVGKPAVFSSIDAEVRGARRNFDELLDYAGVESLGSGGAG